MEFAQNQSKCSQCKRISSKVDTTLQSAKFFGSTWLVFGPSNVVQHTSRFNAESLLDSVQNASCPILRYSTFSVCLQTWLAVSLKLPPRPKSSHCH
ncbi:hypothetical protein L596_003212 [Steinernema carpocapsae]|uniref:Uncharacterized protein n=1 Tax=Steinernema carpocapsae TaxID=34508 RepID=A0A4U8USJ0_STECR|nr:hypothetical protein L596_003212 [Steinernema carpocapsae]